MRNDTSARPVMDDRAHGSLTLPGGRDRPVFAQSHERGDSREGVVAGSEAAIGVSGLAQSTLSPISS